MSTALSLPNQDRVVLLRITKGANRGENYKVVPPGVVIGRDPESCKIVLNDLRVSRQQCRIDFKSNGVTIEDLSKKQTTLVNQQPIEYVTLQSGDVINLGDTQITFEISTDGAVVTKKPTTPDKASKNPLAKFSFGSSKQTDGPPKSKLPKFIMIALVVLVIGFLMLPSKKKGPPPEVATAADQTAAIDAVIKRQEELQKDTKDLSGRERYNKRRAEEHFIRGFRDYQNGVYNRAIEAFQTTLATDPSHRTARRYYKLAKKKQQDMVDYHMDLGNKYKQKNMYRYCIAEFEKVLQIINEPNDSKYKLAKEQMKECRLARQGNF